MSKPIFNHVLLTKRLCSRPRSSTASIAIIQDSQVALHGNVIGLLEVLDGQLFHKHRFSYHSITRRLLDRPIGSGMMLEVSLLIVQTM